MGANLVMNLAAVLPDRRHLNAQGLADGAATLARANQSDQGDFPGSESVFSRQKAYPATTRTSEFSLTGKVLTFLSLAPFSRPTFVKQAARAVWCPGFGSGRSPRRLRQSAARLQCRCRGMMSSRKGQGKASPWHPPQGSPFYMESSAS
jgi:hypothetical protein